MVKGNVKVIERPESLPINFVLDNRSTEYLGDDEAVIYLGSDINNAYYEPLDFCKRQIDFISEMLSKIFEKIWEELSRELIGEVIDYFSNLGVMVTKLTGALKDGDMIVIEGATTYFSQKVESMEINKVKVQVCNNCDVGIKVKDRARPNDKVYRLIDKVPKDKGSSTIIKHF